MDEMKYDMCGAGSVLGTFRAIGEMGLKLNVVGIIAACENMPSGRATKPGDIVTAMNGTDHRNPQHRRRRPPDAVRRPDLRRALQAGRRGRHRHPDRRLHRRAGPPQHRACSPATTTPTTRWPQELMDAGKQAGDTAWRLPIGEQYNEQLKSNFADLANIGTPGGASITAACFLENFTRNYTWAHLDIAGTAWKSGGGEGRDRPSGAAADDLPDQPRVSTMLYRWSSQAMNGERTPRHPFFLRAISWCQRRHRAQNTRCPAPRSASCASAGARHCRPHQHVQRRLGTAHAVCRR